MSKKKNKKKGNGKIKKVSKGHSNVVLKGQKQSSGKGNKEKSKKNEYSPKCTVNKKEAKSIRKDLTKVPELPEKLANGRKTCNHACTRVSVEEYRSDIVNSAAFTPELAQAQAGGFNEVEICATCYQCVPAHDSSEIDAETVASNAIGLHLACSYVMSNKTMSSDEIKSLKKTQRELMRVSQDLTALIRDIQSQDENPVQNGGNNNLNNID